MDLIGSERLLEWVETILYSGRVKNESPLSTLLIATPECGKTSAVAHTIVEGKCKTAVSLTDVTGKGLMKLCQQDPKISHFIFNDLVAVMAHKENVNRYTLSILMALTEEGIQMVAGPMGIENFQSGKRGVIACSTPGMAKDKRTWWRQHGLASRMIPFYFDHSPELQIRIKDEIEKKAKGDTKRKKKVPGEIELRIRIPNREVNVRMEKKFSDTIRHMAETKAVYLGDPKGYRRLRQYLALAKSHALARGRREVSGVDIQFLERVDPFISYSKACQL